MKSIKFAIGLVLIATGATAQAQDSGALILTPEGEGIAVELYTGDEPITSFDLSVPLQGDLSSVSIDDCVSGLPSTHMGNCNVDANGNFKLIVFSPSNATLSSGQIGAIRIPALNAKFESAEVHAFSPNGDPAQFEFLSPINHAGDGGDAKYKQTLPNPEIVR